MPSYDWVCHVCKTSNSAGVDACQACGFSAVADGRQIEAEASGQKRETIPSRKELEERRRKEIASLPLWKTPFAYALQGMQAIGALIFALNVFSLAWDGIAVGLATIAIAEIILQLTVRGQDGQQSQ